MAARAGVTCEPRPGSRRVHPYPNTLARTLHGHAIARILKENPMRTPPLRPLLLALSLALGATAMTAHAQNAAGYAVPTDGTLLSVSARPRPRACPTSPPSPPAWSPRPPTATPRMRAERRADGQGHGRDQGGRHRRQATSRPAASTSTRNTATSRTSRRRSPATRPATPSTSRCATSPSWARCWTRWPPAAPTRSTARRFEIDKPEPVYDEARLAALKKAQARAETYAKSLGLRVRRIVSISEGGGGIPARCR